MGERSRIGYKIPACFVHIGRYGYPIRIFLVIVEKWAICYNEPKEEYV